MSVINQHTDDIVSFLVKVKKVKNHVQRIHVQTSGINFGRFSSRLHMYVDFNQKYYDKSSALLAKNPFFSSKPCSKTPRDHQMSALLDRYSTLLSKGTYHIQPDYGGTITVASLFHSIKGLVIPDVEVVYNLRVPRLDVAERKREWDENLFNYEGNNPEKARYQYQKHIERACNTLSEEVGNKVDRLSQISRYYDGELRSKIKSGRDKYLADRILSGDRSARVQFDKKPELLETMDAYIKTKEEIKQLSNAYNNSI